MNKLLISVWCLCFPLLAAAQTNFTPQQGDKITTDNGIYIVSGENLIENGSFDDGLSNWTAGDGSNLSSDYFSIESSGGADGGAYLKALDGAGSGSSKSVKTGWAIEAGKTYVFSCWALRTQSGMSSNTQYSRLYESDSKTATNTQIGSISYTADTWTQTIIVFTATKNYCVVNLGWLNAASSFDCFFLGEVTASSELATAALEQLVADAEQLYGSTVEGDGKGEFTADVRSTFMAAINAAKSVLANATTQDEITSAVEALNSAIEVYNNAKNPPFKTGGKYVIRHRASNLYMTSAGASGSAVYVSAFANGNNQLFVFDPAPDGSEATGYNLHDADGNYVYRSGSWDLFSGTTTLTEKNAIYNVVENGDWYQIKNMGSGSVLGTDGTSDGSAIYSNKNGTNNTKNDWLIEEYSITMTIDAAIEQAEGLIAEAIIGNSPGNMPQSAVDALRAAIATAQSDKSGVTTFEEAQTVAATLLEAIDKFNESVVPLSEYDTAKIYAITHRSGNVLTVTEGGNAAITELASTDEEATSQRLVLESIGDLQYRIKSQDGRYLAKSGSYNTVWQEDGTTAASLFQVVLLKGNYVGLMCMDNNKYLGTDATSSGALVYSDKTGENNENAYWTISEYQLKTTVDKSALDAAISEATALAEAMKQGWKQGEYYLSDINAFKETVAKAKTDYNSLTVQEDVDAAVTQLKADMAKYQGKAHTTDVAISDYLNDLLPIYEAECNAADVGTEYGQYPVDAQKAYATAIANARQADPVDESTVEALEKARETFLASKNDIDRTALKTEIDKADKAISAAVVGDCQGQYSQAAVDALAAAVASAREALDDKTLTQEQVDSATVALKAANVTFAGQAVTISFDELRSAIATANKTMENAEAEKGEGPGKYPSSAFDTLQGIVDKAETMVGSDTVNQKSVDDMVATLTAATESFNNSRVDNNYADLQNAINQAQAIYDEWAARTDLSQSWIDALADLKASIDRNSDALTSTSQAAIDRATKIMLRDIELFQNVTSGIKSISVDTDTPTAVYDLKGRRISTPLGHGVYIINGKKVFVK